MLLNLEQVDLLSVQCLVKEGRKALYGLISCFLSRLLCFNMPTNANLSNTCSHWILVECILYTFIYLTASTKPSMSAGSPV